MSAGTVHSTTPVALPVQVARNLNSIREPRMRQAALAEFLTGSPADTACNVIVAWIHLAQARVDADAAVALDTLGAVLEDEVLVSYEVRKRLYTAARDAGHDEVAPLLFDRSPATISQREASRALAPERPVEPRGRPLTLGERKALARSHRREMLQHILRDPHPEVIRIVLDNPHLTERDVLVLASRRPSPPESLAAIAAHPRWRVRYPVKRALVLNPHTLVHLSIRLTTTLRTADLRAVAADPNLPEPLRHQAEQLLGHTQPSS